jgi:hypothetical protein
MAVVVNDTLSSTAYIPFRVLADYRTANMALLIELSQL